MVEHTEVNLSYSWLFFCTKKIFFAQWTSKSKVSSSKFVLEILVHCGFWKIRPLSQWSIFFTKILLFPNSHNYQYWLSPSPILDASSKTKSWRWFFPGWESFDYYFCIIFWQPGGQRWRGGARARTCDPLICSQMSWQCPSTNSCILWWEISFSQNTPLVCST